MMLAVEAGRIMAIDVVQLANGFDPHLRGLQAHTPARYAAVVSHRVVPVADVMHVASGRQACTRGDADGARRIGGREAGAACGETIDIRRSHDRVTGTRQRPGLVFVGNDEEEVFRFHELDPGGRQSEHGKPAIAARALVHAHSAALDCFGPPGDLAREKFLQIFGRPAVGCDQIAADLLHLFLGRQTVHCRDRGIIELADD